MVPVVFLMTLGAIAMPTCLSGVAARPDNSDKDPVDTTPPSGQGPAALGGIGKGSKRVLVPVFQNGRPRQRAIRDRAPFQNQVSFIHSSNSIPAGCYKEAIVVEAEEWDPEVKVSLQKDTLSNTYLAVIFLRLPKTSLAEDGAVFRLQSSQLPKFSGKYSLIVKKDKTVVIRKDYLKDYHGMEVVESQSTASTTATSGIWINSNIFVGIWIAWIKGYLEMGVVGENRLGEPLFSWRDLEDPLDVDQVGVTALRGSAFFVGLDCNISTAAMDIYPVGSCASQMDCVDLPNTMCGNMTPADTNYSSSAEPAPAVLDLRSFDFKKGTQMAAAESPIKISKCTCLEGFVPIPEPLRLVNRGCFDPIGETQTVNAVCLSDRHCRNLMGTHCVPATSYGVWVPNLGPHHHHHHHHPKHHHSETQTKTCQCLASYLPIAEDLQTGLVKGCRWVSLDELLSTQSCRTMVTISEGQMWVPLSLVPVEQQPLSDSDPVYFTFYLNFGSADIDTTVSLKLLTPEKSADKMYRVELQSSGHKIYLATINLCAKETEFFFVKVNKNTVKETASLDIQLVHHPQLANNDSNYMTYPTQAAPSDEPGKYVGFWIKYYPKGEQAGTVILGSVGEEAGFLMWQDMKYPLEEIGYLGLEVIKGGTVRFAVNCFNLP